MLGDHQVFHHGHVGEQADVLERPGNPHLSDLAGFKAKHRFPVEEDLTLGGRDHARDGVEERGLPGTVRAYDTDDLSVVDVKIKTGKSIQAPKGDLQTSDLQQAHDGAP